jgi:hypothetical protein
MSRTTLLQLGPMRIATQFLARLLQVPRSNEEQLAGRNCPIEYPHGVASYARDDMLFLASSQKLLKIH